MAVNITRHPLPNREYGQRFPARPLAVLGGQALALDTNSAALIGPCLVWMTADEDVKLDVKSVAADLDTAGAVLRLYAGISEPFMLGDAETLYVRAAAI